MDIGILQWFHVGERDLVEQTLRDLQALGVTHLRTGLSWAEWVTPQGREWYLWLIPRLAQEVSILPCLCYTPPMLAVQPRCNAPPRDLADYASFVDDVLHVFGHRFDTVELWNEPNNPTEWDDALDPGWHAFCLMIREASAVAKRHRKRAVLGGMSPADPAWLALLLERGALEHIDVVGVHAFPGTWEREFSFSGRIAALEAVLRTHGSLAKVWITEVGFSTWQGNEKAQVRLYDAACAAPVERVYWYSLYDLHQKHLTVREATTGERDAREYCLGMRKADGTPKLLYLRLAKVPVQLVDRS